MTFTASIVRETDRTSKPRAEETVGKKSLVEQGSGVDRPASTRFGHPRMPGIRRPPSMRLRLRPRKPSLDPWLFLIWGVLPSGALPLQFHNIVVPTTPGARRRDRRRRTCSSSAVMLPQYCRSPSLKSEHITRSLGAARTGP